MIIKYSTCIAMYPDTSSGSSTSCLTTGAAVGGAIGTPLLLIILLLLVALVCAMRRSGKKNEDVDIVMQRNELYMDSKFSASQLQSSRAPPTYGAHCYNTVDIPAI